MGVFKGYCDFHREFTWLLDGFLWSLGGHSVVLMCRFAELFFCHFFEIYFLGVPEKNRASLLFPLLGWQEGPENKV
jgi:hypothetical protein